MVKGLELSSKHPACCHPFSHAETHTHAHITYDNHYHDIYFDNQMTIICTSDPFKVVFWSGNNAESRKEHKLDI